MRFAQLNDMAFIGQCQYHDPFLMNEIERERGRAWVWLDSSFSSHIYSCDITPLSLTILDFFSSLSLPSIHHHHPLLLLLLGVCHLHAFPPVQQIIFFYIYIYIMRLYIHTLKNLTTVIFFFYKRWYKIFLIFLIVDIITINK